ncbi:Acetylxylan esterase 2 [Cladorrhinum sp. PSN259]|nr:Acetylxylan esterase 2 [Cladorrhinum sp. PSN259]
MLQPFLPSKVLLLLLLLASLPPTLSQQQPSPKCPPLHILTARETTAPEGHGSNTPLLNLLTNSSLFPSTLTTEIIIYPAAGGPEYSNSVTTGIAAVIKQTATFAARCPSTPLILLGYSQGAQIIDDAFCGGPDLPSLESTGSLVMGLVRRNTVAIVMMGNPRFGGGKTTDQFAARPKGFSCPLFQERIVSYCDSPDPFCSDGDDEATHQGYGEVYGKDSLAFIMSKILL